MNELAAPHFMATAPIFVCVFRALDTVIFAGSLLCAYMVSGRIYICRINVRNRAQTARNEERLMSALTGPDWEDYCLV